jgi:hypothetical protein
MIIAAVLCSAGCSFGVRATGHTSWYSCGPDCSTSRAPAHADTALAVAGVGFFLVRASEYEDCDHRLEECRSTSALGVLFDDPGGIGLVAAGLFIASAIHGYVAAARCGSSHRSVTRAGEP